MKPKVRSKSHLGRHFLYIGLLLLALGLGAVWFPAPLRATNPASGLVTITAVVRGPSPAIASVINVPKAGQSFTTATARVSGSCPSSGLVIKLIDNGAFAGSTLCTDSRSFALTISLSRGRNELVAQEFDAMDQQGPDSAPVTVYYNPTTGVAAVSKTPLSIELATQFNSYTGCMPGQSLSLPLKISGGAAPYAVHIDWGDGSSDLISIKNSDEPLLGAHNFAAGGNYEVTITASDNAGASTQLSVAVVINGQPKSAAQAFGQEVQKLWPSSNYVIVGLILLLVGFIMAKISDRPRPPKFKSKR